ncbi:MAG: ThiF family adenylyltransferase [Actinobacteria bacterium]|nr:ThiF family adenylyltransferase [Actinomycetota bacterium]MCG2797996.1 ThiF family adenylyltransferase [Cellulomonas sp.]
MTGRYPLVDPGPELSATQTARYARHLLLAGFGAPAQRRLAASRVLVVGAGGLGSPVLTYLAAAGVGTIGVVDDDLVDASNLQRQTVHTVDDIGRPKTDSARESIARINPLVSVETYPFRLVADNAVDLIGRFDLVVDGADNFPTRYLVSDACRLTGRPHVWGSVLGFDGQVSAFWSDPPPELGPGVTLRDVFPTPPPAGAVPSCAVAGVLGVVCGSVGSAMATEAVKLITGVGTPALGRVLVLDALAGQWREVPVAPDPTAGPVDTFGDLDGCTVPPTGPQLGARAAVTAPELSELLAGGTGIDLVDVRETGEHALVAIPGSRLIPLAALLDGSAVGALRDDVPVILYCRSGQRSAQALSAVHARGRTDVRHLDGGVLAWIDQIDQTLPRY